MNVQRCLLLSVAGMSVAVLALLATGCDHNSPAAGTEAAPETPTVSVASPTPQTIIRLIQQPGFNRPYEQTAIYAKIAGYVQKWYVDRGGRVKKGDLLAKLRVPEMDQQLKSKEARLQQTRAELTQAQEGLKAAEANVNTSEAIVKEAFAGVDQAGADYRRWQAEYERGKKLLAGNVYDKQTLDEALSQMKQSEAGKERASAKLNSSQAMLVESRARRNKAVADVEAAQARVQVAEADVKEQAAWLDYANIRAPYDGVVTELNIKTEDFVQPASSGSTNTTARPLFVVVRMDIMRMTVQVPEYDAVLIKDGDPAIVRYQALPGREFLGKVTLSSWTLDPQARTLLVEIHLTNTPKEELRPGMYANVTIEATVPNALVLPAEAVLDSVLDEGEKHYCFIVEKGKAVRTNIRTGVRTSKVVQVLEKQAKPTSPGQEGAWEKFSGNEQVVTSNPASLLDGQSVLVAPTK